MFPTFTGSSRRPRNVNLSGQRNTNPFAANSWSPSSASGASKTVADAQAERRQRQQERDRLKAAQDIQRIWRAQMVRRTLRNARRNEFDELYASKDTAAADERVLLALPIFLAFFQESNDEDIQRLVPFARDLERSHFSTLTCNADVLPPKRLERLSKVLIAALQRCDATSTAPALLVLLVHILATRPEAVQNDLGPYFQLICRFFQADGIRGSDLAIVKAAMLAPLAEGRFSSRAHHEFALSFLTVPLGLLEKDLKFFTNEIDLNLLSEGILEAFTSQSALGKSQDELLWLLAHFVGIQRSQPHIPRSTLLLQALSTQLSVLCGHIRLVLPTRGAALDTSALPPFIATEISSLVDRQEVSGLLEKFTSHFSGPERLEFEEASLLAGYILTLIRCFPARGDDIRMRLYLADLPFQNGKLPAVKLFWSAMIKTSVFGRINWAPDNTLEFLQQRHYFRASASSSNSHWDQEWRTVLLFLELYTFVLRLTDDEDFIAGLGLPTATTTSTSRVASCTLALAAIRDLSRFLKNLAFTLHYNSANLLRTSEGGESSGTYDVISGIDFTAFKNTVTTALQMLYERDSRRKFLPKDHWLMTSNFDMEGFISAVVLEEQHQHELMETGDSDDEDEEDEADFGGDHAPILSAAFQRQSRHVMLERMKAQQKKAARDRIRASVGPKLEILRNMPYVIPFEIRVQIFRQFVYLDKERRRAGNVDAETWWMHLSHQHHGSPHGRDILSRHTATIKRNSLFSDAFDQFYGLGEGLKEPIQITFVDKFETVEAGIDGGGVTKEFLTSVTKEAFNSDMGFFVANKSNALYPNPLAVDQAIAQSAAAFPVASDELREASGVAELGGLLERFEFLGRIVGKCLYEGILIDVAFAGFFLLKWVSSATDSVYRASINDLREMDEDLYQGMLALKNYAGDVSALDLDFTINDQVSRPDEQVRTVTRNLIPDGKTPVTNENRPLYISYVARHRLVAQPRRQTAAFLKGLGSIIDPSWLSMFNQLELQRLVGGDSSEIDVEDLRRHTVYSGVYEIGYDGEEHDTIKLFWQVMRNLKDSERRDVLKYVTSTPRAPLLGFAQLRPSFSIRDGGGDETRLPSASTCVNLLKLPRYNDAATLRSKLLYAVSSNAGFDLS